MRGGINLEDKTIICRCEDVSTEEIRELLREGFTTLDEIKRISRCGMGPCQGRTCRALIAGEIARATGKDIREVAVPTFRPPTRPVKLGTILEGEGHGE